MSKVVREFIREVLSGFGNKEFGKDGVSGNLYPTGVGTGDAGIRPQAHSNILDDEEGEEETLDQDVKQAACCLIMTQDGLVLGVSRKDDPTAFGMPGGKVDPGETPEQAAARELQEETGLTATKLSLVFKRQDGDGFVTSTFACEVEGQIDTPESGVIRWVKPSVMFAGPFGDYNKRLWAKLGLPSD
jgi:8-oxo-dGTP pyrophosphatase MutT (NUDIX family)